MALNSVKLEMSTDTKRMIHRLTEALEKLGGGETRDQSKLQQYLHGDENGFEEEEGHNFVVRITGCTEEQAQRVMGVVAGQMTPNMGFPYTVEWEKR